MNADEFDFENRMLGAEYQRGDENEENSLRPKRLEDYIGQDKVKDNLKVYIDAARLRGDSLDHVLLYGPPGLGKTIRPFHWILKLFRYSIARFRIQWKGRTYI